MMRRSFPLLLVEVACCAATACTSENADAYATGVELPCCAGLEMELKDWNGDRNWFYKCMSRQSCPHDVAVVQPWSDHGGGDHMRGVMTILDVENNVSLGTLTHPTPGEMGEFNYYYYAGNAQDRWAFSARIASSGKIVTADRGREVGIIWSATGTKLKEIPRFVMADETYVVRTAYRGDDGDEPFNATSWWPPIEAAHVFSPDGNRLLGKNDGNPTIVNILDMESMESLCELTHNGPVRVASFDSAGLRVLTVEKSGDVTTWNASDCRIVARIPYGGNKSHWTDSVAWAANGRLVAMIETDSWSGPNPPWGIRVHLPRRLVLFEATTGQQVHSTSLTQKADAGWDCHYECAPLIYARGEIILVNIRYHSRDDGYWADDGSPVHVGGGPYMADVTIFNASNGAMLQDFTQRNWSKVGVNLGLYMMDVDLQGEYLLVSEHKKTKDWKHRAASYSISREIWDVTTGSHTFLHPYNHSEAKGFVGAGTTGPPSGRWHGRLTVEKELHLKAYPYRIRRTQIVDLETQKQIASLLGKQKAYATVTTCDDHFVVV